MLSVFSYIDSIVINNFEVRVIENNSVASNLIRNVPRELLGKLNLASTITASEDGKIEVSVLYGQHFQEVREHVDNIGGQIEDLGYGFGIVYITLDKVGALAASNSIQYIELPKSLYLTDISSNTSACVQTARDEFGVDGGGVVIGFIDSGIDFTHPAFINEDGTSRIEYIYDLSTGGSIYDREMINEALKSKDPFSVVPSYDVIEHGTHVVGIACAGGKIPSNYYGVAPKSSIMMVKSARGNFALSTQLMKGLKFLIDKAYDLKMPLVVNLSLSTNDGAHNGSSLLEQYIDTIATLERVTIVVAAGNEGDADHHVGSTLSRENFIKFNVASDETSVVINLYKSILPTLSIELIAPNASTTGEIEVAEGYKEGVIAGNRYQIYNTGPKPFDINGEIGVSLISFGNYIVQGEWTIVLRVLNQYEGIYDMWLPVLEGLNQKTKFLQPNINNTLGIPGTVATVITVGSYNYITRRISPFSGRGLVNFYGNSKPDVVAPGESIIAPVPNGSYDRKTGTSMATPHVSGICALLMQWGIVRKNDAFLYGDRLKHYLIIAARKTRPDVTYPDPSWGYGEACVDATFKKIVEVLNIVNTAAPDYRLVAEDKKTVSGYLSQFNKSDEKVGLLVEFNNRDDFLKINDIPGATAVPEISAVTISDNYGLVYLPIRRIDEIKPYIKQVIDVDNPPIYTLNTISPLDASGVSTYLNNPYLSLSGSGVVIATMDTGIDYLNKEFQREDGTTRILRIWDQTVENKDKVYGINLGAEYTKEQINEAIKLQSTGGDPYSIVPSKDDNGHGTMTMGVAASRGINISTMGPARDCDIIVVKLKPAGPVALTNSGITKPNVLAYSLVEILMAIRYINLVMEEIKEPMVLLVGLGTNNGSHEGLDTLSQILNNTTKIVGNLCVVGTGNQGDTDTHTEDVITKKGDTKTIEIRVGKNQKTLNFEIWISKPDVMSLSIISPSGEKIERIPPKLGQNQDVNFIYEGTYMNVIYEISDDITGNQSIVIKAVDIREGIWKFELYGDYIVNGRYYAWLPQRSLLDEDTKFLDPVAQTTIVVPAVARNVLAVSYYNQNNDAVVGSSGRGYTKDGRIKPDIAAGGMNAIILKPGGGTGIASGSSIATALVAGTCALLLEWAIVKDNDPGIRMQQVISYIIRGAKTRGGDTYPNPEWGYGILDFQGSLDAIRGYFRQIEEEKYYEEFTIGKLFIRKPTEIFHK